MKKLCYSFCYSSNNSKFMKLWEEVKTKGTCKESKWKDDYIVSEYDYNNKTYYLWYNAELGIPSEIYY